MDLDPYQRKRDFKKTPEPEGRVSPSRTGRLYVIQKHAARRLHYDLRLEVNGVLKSWAVPKGPSLDPREKRLAIEVEDHPIAYGDFEGVIPPKEYGAGTVLVWDHGHWEPIGDPEEGLKKGNLKFTLHGRKLKGAWALVRMNHASRTDKNEWLLIKHRDDAAVDEGSDTLLEDAPDSVVTGRRIDQVAEDRDHLWQEGRSVPVAGRTAGSMVDPSGLARAREADVPEFFQPQLARPTGQPPEGDDWLHEIKYDGYRLLCVIKDRQVRLITRNRQDWSDRFGEIVREAAHLPVRSAILDGEVTMQRADGTTDFQALQNYFKGKKGGRLVYYLFDLPYCQGYDLSAVPLIRRKEMLKTIYRQSPAGPSSVLQLSGEIKGQGREVYRKACQLGIEGIISKRADAVYEQRRAATWFKVKCVQRQEFVIGGLSESDAAAGGLRSLLVGYYRSGRWIYAGKVGTGFSMRQRRELKQRLLDLEQTSAPFDNPPKEKNLRWVRPQLVVEVSFAEWTQDGVLRHPVFQGLREDKPAEQVVLETAAAFSARTESEHRQGGAQMTEKQSGAIAGVRLTHPDRVLYPQFGLTKEALARYYQHVSEYILPYITHRPLTLVRCPQGSTNACFYQKHFNETLPEALKAVRIREGKEENDYIYIEDLPGLIALVQISVLEIHPWGSRIDRLEQPDTLIFDLDPDPELDWEHVVQAAWHLRGILQGRGFTSFVKTSGGKGLHVQMPIDRTIGWPEAKDFAREIASLMAGEQPRRYTDNSRKAGRKGKIYIDYLRNARGATSVAPYSTRARAGAPVSTPLQWEELSARIGPDAFTVENLRARMDRLKSDPWHEFTRTVNRISSLNQSNRI